MLPVMIEIHPMNGQPRVSHFRAAFAGIIQRTAFVGQIPRAAQ
jgi:hypothetical protein